MLFINTTDERGITTGHYGFLTPDGIYHVIYFSIDENNDFKIRESRNIRVGFRKFKS
jgi:hypothetical protein